MRRLKRLEDAIGVSVVHWHMDRSRAGTFREGPGATGDRLHGLDYLHQVYTRAPAGLYRPRHRCRCCGTRSSGTIVNNESAEIIRMLNCGLRSRSAPTARDFYPEALRPAIDAINDRVYDTVNNGVYRAGFARSQEAYEEAVTALFATLD